MTIAIIFVDAFYLYLIAGLVFAVWFVAKGVDKIDAGMHDTSWKVRLLLLPGAALLWPFLLKKYNGRT